MAALVADRNTPMRDGELIPVPVKSGVKIYAGAIVVADGGYAKPGVKGENLVYLGRAEEQVDNTAAGAKDGDRSVLLRRGRAFKWANAAGNGAVGQAEFGKKVYIVDDQTVTKTAAGASDTGAAVVVGIESDGVWIG